jgi:hypothetical protein
VVDEEVGIAKVRKLQVSRGHICAVKRPMEQCMFDFLRWQKTGM